MTDLTMSQFASKDDLIAAQAARIAELEAEVDAERHHHGIRNASAVRTLHALGYSWSGTDAWQPPAEQGKCLHQIAEPQADEVFDEREGFVNWLHGTYPLSYTIIQAADLWFHKHVAALAWKARAAISAAQHQQELAAYRFTVANREARIAELESQLEAIGAGGVEPLRKGFVRLTDVLARLEQGFGANSAPVTTIKRHFEMQAAPAHPAEGVHAQAVELEVDDLIDRLLNAQQDLNLAANVHMDQSIASASTLLDEVEIALRTLAATHPTHQGLDARTAYEAECFRWLRDEALKVWKKGPVVFMTDADGCPGDGGAWSDNILSGKKLERAIPVAAQAKQGEQP
ncbi:hypothetical protein [Comamonas jiangduensis]|uniref:hypothetical protein n=1 Tax=Comamonas jiangduensis TaxID=1194168 RepID=UPI003BF88387